MWFAVRHVSGDSYFIAVATYMDDQRLTISGVGDPLLVALTGTGHTTLLPGFVWKFVLKPFVAP